MVLDKIIQWKQGHDCVEPKADFQAVGAYQKACATGAREVPIGKGDLVAVPHTHQGVHEIGRYQWGDPFQHLQLLSPILSIPRAQVRKPS
jgi:hypothetical protein